MKESTLELFKRLEDANLTVFDLIKDNTASKVEKGKIEEVEIDDLIVSFFHMKKFKGVENE